MSAWAMWSSLGVLASISAGLLWQLTRTLAHTRAGEQRLAELIRESPDAIVVFDARGTVLSMSPAVERITGYRPEQLVGRTMTELPFLDDESRDRGVVRFSQSKAGAPNTPTVYPIRRADGSAGAIEISRRMVEPANGERVLEAVVRDVTDRVAAERENARLEQQLRHAQRLESIGRLAGGVAHEFNNALTAIIGGLEVMSASPSFPDRLRRELDIARTASQRAADVTRRLLSFSRSAGGDDGPVVVDVHDELRGARDMLDRLVGENVALEVALAADHHRVRIEPTGISQIVVNLAVNACDAMPTGGELAITTEDEGSQLVLRVRDTGAGIPEDVRPHLFEPYFTTKDPSRGTGLGLSVVHGIVTGAGGTIEVLAPDGGGTEMVIRLPAERAEVTPTPRPPPVAEGAPATLLVVDDDPAVGAATRLLLELDHHRVVLARDSEEAVAAIEELGEDIDLLITDVVLAGERGVDVAARVRARQPGIPVLYMSGYADSAIDGDEITADSFLAKPFTPDELLARVRRALDRA